MEQERLEAWARSVIRETYAFTVARSRSVFTRKAIVIDEDELVAAMMRGVRELLMSRDGRAEKN